MPVPAGLGGRIGFGSNLTGYGAGGGGLYGAGAAAKGNGCPAVGRKPPLKLKNDHGWQLRLSLYNALSGSVPIILTMGDA